TIGDFRSRRKRGGAALSCLRKLLVAESLPARAAARILVHPKECGMNVQRSRSVSAFAAAMGVVACAIALAGCDNHGRGKGSYSTLTAPTIDPFAGISVTIVPGGSFSASVLGVPCVTAAAPGVDLRITTSGTVDMNAVTLRLGDGVSVGGPS